MIGGIRARLLLLVGLAIVPLFLFAVFQGLEERRRAAARERADARRLVLLFAAQHERVVSSARRVLFVMAQAPAVRAPNAAACSQLFRDVLADSPEYSNLVLADAQGNVTAAAYPTAITAEDRALLIRARASTFAVGPILTLGNTHFPTLGFAHAVPAEGQEPRPVLLARAGMRWVADEFRVAGLEALTRVTLWGPSGRILLRYPDPEGFLGRDASTSEVWKAIVATGGEGTTEAAGGDGVRRLYGFTKLTGESGEGRIIISLGVPIDVAFADLRRLERRNLFVLVLVTALGAASAWLGGERLVRLFGGLQRMAERDALTGLANRRRLLSVGQDEHRRARRLGHPLAALMLDLDHFKQVNDRHGHGAGDDVLRETARRIQGTVREIDLAARYGGEEFAVLLPDTTLEKALHAAERIRLAVEAAPVVTRKGPVPVTLSAGVAVLDDEGELASLFEAADAGLYAAKAAGRNRVATAPAPGVPRALTGSTITRAGGEA
jgi:diguanylate cyclase (GGDEF)-like protein